MKGFRALRSSVDLLKVQLSPPGSSRCCAPSSAEPRVPASRESASSLMWGRGRPRIRGQMRGDMRYGVRRCGVCAGSIRRVNATDMHPVLVVDFGAQYAQLIARRVREANVYSEIVPHTMSVADMLAKEPAAIILSGGPSSVYEEGAPPSIPRFSRPVCPS